MVGNNSQPDFDFNDFRRYHNGEMSAQEQHSFEKRMLEEPLVADAYEGFLALNEDQIDYKSALTNLDEALKERTQPEQKRALPMWAYASAASVCLLAGLSWVYFTSNKSSEHQNVAFEMSIGKPDQIAEPEEGVKTPPIPQAASTPALTLKSAPPSSTETSPATDELAVIVPAAPSQQEHKILGNKLEEAVAENDLESIAIVESIPASAPVAASSAQLPLRKSAAKVGQDYAAGASIALPSSRPVPVNGWESYQSYLLKNSVAEGKSGEVEVTFTVQTDSTLSAFSAKGDPSLNDKAILTVKNGPLWVPAKFNGRAIVSQTKVTLQFRISN